MNLKSEEIRPELVHTMIMSTKNNVKVAPSWRNRNMRSVHHGVAGHQSWTVTKKGIGIGHVIEEPRVVRPVAVSQRP